MLPRNSDVQQNEEEEEEEQGSELRGNNLALTAQKSSPAQGSTSMGNPDRIPQGSALALYSFLSATSTLVLGLTAGGNFSSLRDLHTKTKAFFQKRLIFGFLLNIVNTIF